MDSTSTNRLKLIALVSAAAAAVASFYYFKTVQKNRRREALEENLKRKRIGGGGNENEGIGNNGSNGEFLFLPESDMSDHLFCCN
jgi:hypothetical protein